ncbi:MAG: M23 family metallopeptidase, partial [candidate division Zixibacteria bacterium]|nr:M23 family metallopeptidase [candidate division Zixibacteria bacterium]
MIKVSTILTAVLVIASLMVTPSAKGARRWPVDGTIDLSSTFGEIRERHFHGGIDIRTGGKVGTTVLSPVDGYVWRVKMSYYGSGKCLYIMGDDGHIYVFGHLSELAGRIDHAVKAAQMAARRYYLDVYYPSDSIRISKGEFLAYSGKTGATAPHLHFEVRSADNVPINPLTHGFDLPDNVRPSFQRLGFQVTDDRSLFLSGRRRMFVDVVRQKKAGDFTIDTLLYFNHPFGILVDGHDLIRVGGMRQAIYSLTVYIDGKLFYESQYDSLDFETTDAVLLEYDYLEAVDNRKRVRRLFKSPGNRFAGSRGSDHRHGVFGRGGAEKVGLHQVRIVAEDCSGNSAELSFRFLWCPRENVYELDSLVTRPADTSLFFFTPIAGYERLRIDSVKALRNVQERWGAPSTVHVRHLENGQLKCVAIGRGVDVAVLRLFLFTEGGGLIRDLLFNGIQESQPDRCELFYEVIDDGLLITVKSP